jgi:hypothetical protein
MSEYIKKYIEDVNKINEEIKAIKSADCIMDYDAKTEIINHKMKAIETIDMNFKTLVSAGVHIKDIEQK